jgi:ribulose bisphosphate carboxylase small subunit
MPNLLTNLELEELSLVDRPANAQAMVSLFKRDSSVEKENDPMTDEEMKAKMKPYMDKGMSEADAKKKVMEDMAKALEDVEKFKAENEKLRKSLLDEGYKITADGVEKRQPEETITVDGVAVNKSDIPAPVLKALEEAEVQKREAAIAKRCEEMAPNLDKAIAKSLIEKADELEDNKALLEFISAVDALFEKQFTEAGATGENGDLMKAEDKLDALVKEYMAENSLTKRDYAKAYAAVVKTDAGKELVHKMYKGD